MNDFPVIVLKPEDSAPPPDPQTTVIELTEMLATLVGELAILRDRMTRWSYDPLGVCRMAQPRLVELHEQAGRIQDHVQTLSQGYRAAGRFSATYSPDLGVR